MSDVVRLIWEQGENKPMFLCLPLFNAIILIALNSGGNHGNRYRKATR